MSGVESITLLQTEMPAHAHGVGRALAADGNVITPVNSVWAQSAAGRGLAALYLDGAPTGQVNINSLNVSGGGLPHNNMQPYLTLNFCIALQGIFPQRP
jgi:microcystin-dependent protein